MSSLNRIILVGTLNSDPEIRSTTTGETLSKMVISVDRPDRGEGLPKQSDWIQVVAWRQVAEFTQAFKQGDLILVDGRISTRSYDDNQGQRQYVTEVEAREVMPFNGAKVPVALGGAAPAEKPAKATRATKVKETPVLQETEFDFGDTGFSPEDVAFPSGFSAPVEAKDLEDEVPF